MSSSTTVSLRPTGIGRYISAVFLSFWLVGWIIGEAFAILMLITIATPITGVVLEHLPARPPDFVTSGGVAFALLFLLFWLTVWTIGGIVALTYLTRSLVGEDVIGLTASGFEVVRRVGPFRRRYALERSAIRRLRSRRHDRAVLADTTNGTRVITTFGAPAERDAVIDWLTEHLGLHDADATAGATPAAWDVRIEGETAHVRKVRPGVRLTRALTLWLLTVAMASALYASSDPEAMAASTPALVLTLFLAAGAAMITWGRREWIVRPGELMFRRSFATWTDERTFKSARLELTHEIDSDNDDHYNLIVVGAAGRRTLHSQAYDSGEVVDLGRWLAARTGFPLTSADKINTVRGRRAPSG